MVYENVLKRVPGDLAGPILKVSNLSPSPNLPTEQQANYHHFSHLGGDSDMAFYSHQYILYLLARMVG